jgi:hypothetical protein
MLSIKKRIAGSFAACFFLLSVGCAELHAQNAQILEIDATHKAMLTVDERCGDEVSDFCGYYVNRIQVNGYGGPWADVGSYGSTQQFWYEFVDGEEGPERILRYIEIETRRSTRQETEEYLYDAAGQLQYYEFVLMIEGMPQQQNKYYLEGDQLLKYNEQVQPEEVEFQKYHKSDVAQVRKDADDLVAVFKSSFR